MKSLKLLQISHLESKTQGYPNSDRDHKPQSPPISIKLNSKNFSKTLTPYTQFPILSLKNKSILQQRQAIRDILEHSSPQPLPQITNLEVKGKQEEFKICSLSPDFTKPRRTLLSPLPNAKASKPFGKAVAERVVVRSDNWNGIRRFIPIQDLALEKNEIESCEESLRFEAKYSH